MKPYICHRNVFMIYQTIDAAIRISKEDKAIYDYFAGLRGKSYINYEPVPEKTYFSLPFEFNYRDERKFFGFLSLKAGAKGVPWFNLDTHLYDEDTKFEWRLDKFKSDKSIYDNAKFCFDEPGELDSVVITIYVDEGEYGIDEQALQAKVRKKIQNTPYV